MISHMISSTETLSYIWIALELFFRDGSLGLAFLLCPAASGRFHPGEEKDKKINPEHQKEYFLEEQIKNIKLTCHQNQEYPYKS